MGSNPDSGRKCPRLRWDPWARHRYPKLLPGRRTVGCPLLQFGWVKCREHISLLIILCIIVYVTNTPHLSLIWIVFVCNLCLVYQLHPKQRHQTHTNSLLSTTVKWGRKEIQPVAWKWSERPLGTSLLFQWGLVSDASTLQSSSACQHWGVTSKTSAGARAGVTPA